MSGNTILSPNSFSVSLPNIPSLAYYPQSTTSFDGAQLTFAASSLQEIGASTVSYGASAPRGISGRRDVPSIGGESDEVVFNKVLINICGSLNFGLSYSELKALFYAVYGFGTAPITWPQFWAWYQQMSGTQDSPVGDILPLLLLSFVAIIAKLLKSINLKLQNHSSENSK